VYIFATITHMSTAVMTIYEAKTNLSKLVKRAAAGETIYIGAFGKAEALLTPLPKLTRNVVLGKWKNSSLVSYSDEDIIGPDEDIQKMFGPDYGLST
jgi:antitoxin (DNA-binding transcriptional repressor) of toxin-antitoxin stability system